MSDLKDNCYIVRTDPNAQTPLHALIRPKKSNGNPQLSSADMLQHHISNGCYDGNPELLKEKKKELEEKRRELKQQGITLREH